MPLTARVIRAHQNKNPISMSLLVDLEQLTKSTCFRKEVMLLAVRIS